MDIFKILKISFKGQIQCHNVRIKVLDSSLTNMYTFTIC
jgi:hypothetical protein